MNNEYSVKNDSQFSPEINPTERPYHLRAKIWIVDTYAQQGTKGGREKVKAVVLVPQDSDETSRFWRAWLPEDREHIVEVLCEFSEPIFKVARCAVRFADKNYPHGPHLFVMHLWLEEILKRRPFQTIEFTTRPGSEDAQDSHESDKNDTEVHTELA